MQLVQLSTLLLAETARGDPRGITSLAASVSDLSTLEERSDRLRTLGSSSTAIRASVETLLAAPSVHFSTGEAKRLLEPYCIQMIPFLCPVVQIILIRKKVILPAQFWAIM